MSPESFARIVSEFLKDAKTHIDRFEAVLGVLAKDTEDRESLEKAHLHAHTVKGASAMLALRAPDEAFADRLDALSRLSRLAEERIDAALDGSYPLHAEIIGDLARMPELVRDLLAFEEMDEPHGVAVTDGIQALQSIVEKDLARVPPENERIPIEDLETYFQALPPESLDAPAGPTEDIVDRFLGDEPPPEVIGPDMGLPSAPSEEEELRIIRDLLEAEPATRKVEPKHVELGVEENAVILGTLADMVTLPPDQAPAEEQTEVAEQPTVPDFICAQLSVLASLLGLVLEDQEKPDSDIEEGPQSDAVSTPEPVEEKSPEPEETDADESDIDVVVDLEEIEPVAETPVVPAETPVTTDEDDLDELDSLANESDEDSEETIVEGKADDPVDESDIDVVVDLEEIEPVAETPVVPAETPVTTDEDDLDELDSLANESDEDSEETIVEGKADDPVDESDIDDLEDIPSPGEPEKPVVAEVPDESDDADLREIEELSALDESDGLEIDEPEPAEPAEAEEPVAARSVPAEDDPMREIFIEECGEMLSLITAALDVLTNSPDDPGALSDLRRGAHTLKGSAAMLGYESVRGVGLAMEDATDVIIETDHGLRETTHEAMVGAANWIEQASKLIAKTGSCGDMPWEIITALKTEPATGGESEESAQDDPMRHIYLEEIEQLIDQLNHDLIVLEQQPDDAETLNNIFRLAHTVKGSAGTVGYDRSEAVAHHMESVLELVRDAGIAPDAEAIDSLLAGLDAISQLAGDIRADGTEQSSTGNVLAELESTRKRFAAEKEQETSHDPGPEAVSDLSEEGTRENDLLREIFIEEATGILDSLGRDLVELEQTPDDAELVNRALRGAHTLKGSAAMLEFARMRGLSHAMEDSLQVVRDAGATLSADAIDLLLQATDELQALVDSVSKTGVEAGEPSDLSQNLRTLAASLTQETAGGSTPPVAAVEIVDGSTAHPVDDELRATFLVESGELLTQLTRATVALESAPGNADARLQFIRAGVALTGSAAALGFIQIANMTGAIEAVIQKAQETDATLDPEAIDAVAEGMEILSKLFATLRQDGHDNEPDASKATARLNQITPSQVVASSQERAAEVQPEQAADNKRSRRRIVEVDLGRLNRLMNLAAELVISRTRLSTELTRLGTVVSALGNQGSSLGNVERRLEDIVAAGKGDGGGTFSPDEGVLTGFTESEFDRFSDVDIVTRDLRDSSTLISDIGGEFASLAGSFEENITRISSIATELHDEILRVRMARVERTFTRIPRIVRDAARSEGKQVKLILEGTETELDKNILEALNTPIMHMIRNMVSHGIETPEERTSRGKSEAGTVTVRASQEGNQIVIAISDDGRGIDPVRIRRTAMDKGTLTADQAATLTDSEIIDLIFEPGFSSAEKVTDISGRGVGLDAVRSVMTRLNSTVTTETEVGRGTTFRLTLPLTLAIGQALLIQIGERYFAFPLTAVSHIAEITADDITYINEQAHIYREDMPVPLVVLGEVLGMQGLRQSNGEARPVVIIREGDRQMALVVDSIHGREEIVIKDLGSHLRRVPGISGATILGDGSVVMILHTPYFLSARTAVQRRATTSVVATPTPATTITEEPEPEQAIIAKPVETPAERPAKADRTERRPTGPGTILVVDDSISIRKYVSGVLERHRYTVVTANDGLDAWEKMQTQDFALIISDLEMPRMHGYELIGEIKKFERTRSIPVVFLTARAGDKHRRMGIELGAAAFLNKPFKEPELISIISGLMARKMG
jgi:chemosensory pili system protein ChpA (sensor histidine kinase/response regulator)